MAWPTSSRQSRGYGADHDRMREHLLKTVIFCEVCTRQGRVTPGHVADHILPIAKGGTGERSNYQLLCPPHAREKDARDRGAKTKPRIGNDGWPIDD